MSIPFRDRREDLPGGTAGFLRFIPEAGEAGIRGALFLVNALGIIVDTYGGVGRHGGGCFSGKDPTKVDRSGAYAARQAARYLVASGLAHHAEVSLAYAIGVARPIAVNVDTFGTALAGSADRRLAEFVEERFDFRPAAIIERLGLRRPIYRQVATYGHFGRDDLDLPWEQTDDVTPGGRPPHLGATAG